MLAMVRARYVRAMAVQRTGTMARCEILIPRIGTYVSHYGRVRQMTNGSGGGNINYWPFDYTFTNHSGDGMGDASQGVYKYGYCDGNGRGGEDTEWLL